LGVWDLGEIERSYLKKQNRAERVWLVVEYTGTRSWVQYPVLEQTIKKFFKGKYVPSPLTSEVLLLKEIMQIKMWH
jgi:hypothetical protein